MTFVSYARNFEDVMLRRCFGDDASGFYVDVGAGNPKRYSATRSFYESGWSGINIEPSPVFDVLAADRPRDVNLRLALSERAGSATLFYQARSQPQKPSFEVLSTANIVKACSRPRMGFVSAEIEVDVRTLTSILDEHAVGRHIHFLNVNVGGVELRVLSGLDLSEYRPDVIVVRTKDHLSEEDIRAECASLITPHDYSDIFFDGSNSWYASRESHIPAETFQCTADFFDQFVRWHAGSDASLTETLATQEKTIAKLRGQLNDASRELAISRETIEDAKIHAASSEALVFTLETAMDQIEIGSPAFPEPLSPEDLVTLPPGFELEAPPIDELNANLHARRDELIASGLFDSEWYLTKHPDVRDSGYDPADHFLLHGSFELRPPGPLLNPIAYLKRYPDVLQSKTEPWIHFSRHGKSEARLGV